MSVLATQKPRRRVRFYDGPGARPRSDRPQLFSALLERGLSVARSSEPPQAQKNLDSDLDSDEIRVADFEGNDPSASILNIGGCNTEEALQKILSAEAESRAEPLSEKPWKPWFPVIDYDRCTHCMQCLSFCLFGVYGASQTGGIVVQSPSSCKTDCPACSRVCPEVAILFPKYRHGPINGDQVKAEDLQREAMKIDISALLGGDVYKLLRERSAKAKSRFSRERDEDRALEERKRCMNKLKEQMGISDELLAALPSLGEIQDKAEKARLAAAEALARQKEQARPKALVEGHKTGESQ